MTGVIPPGATYTVVTDSVGGEEIQVLKIAFGDAGSSVVVSETNPLPTITGELDVRYKTYEDTSFVTGDSPVTIDLLTDLARYGRSLLVTNDGPGNILVAVSNDGATYSDNRTVQASETFALDGLRLDSVQLTWVANSAYRVVAY